MNQIIKIILVNLLLVTYIFADYAICNAETYCNDFKDEAAIKKFILDETNIYQDNKISEVKVSQMHQMDGYILVEFVFDCCLEGGVTLLKKSEKGYKTIADYGGYDHDDMTPIIRKFFYEKVPKSVMPMIDCYKEIVTK